MPFAPLNGIGRSFDDWAIGAGIAADPGDRQNHIRGLAQQADRFLHMPARTRHIVDQQNRIDNWRLHFHGRATEVCLGMRCSGRENRLENGNKRQVETGGNLLCQKAGKAIVLAAVAAGDVGDNARRPLTDKPVQPVDDFLRYGIDKIGCRRRLDLAQRGDLMLFHRFAPGSQGQIRDGVPRQDRLPFYECIEQE